MTAVKCHENIFTCKILRELYSLPPFSEEALCLLFSVLIALFH